MSPKPRLLVIEREPADAPAASDARRALDEHYEVVRVRSMARALLCLRQQGFAGVYVDAAQLSAVRWAGVLIQADEILDAIADGVAVVDPDLQIIWANPEFLRLTEPGEETVTSTFYRVLGAPEVLGPDPCPFTTAIASKAAASSVLKLATNRYLRVNVTPVFDRDGRPTHLIALTRDVTAEVQQEQKLDAIYKAGEELAELAPDELAEMKAEDRTALLKFNIARHMKGLLGLDFIEIRLLDRATGKLAPLLTEGMAAPAAHRELYARAEGNGVTGFVAATGRSYLCADTARDPLYLEGAVGARSSLTVPLMVHGTLIGTLNVESPHPNAFDDRDRQFLEIYARSVAAALNTLELLHAEHRHVATASVEAISHELALPIDDILSDATTVLDRYAGPDEEVRARLRHLLARAREIRGLIRQVGTAIAPPEPGRDDRPPPKFQGARILVADADESVRRAAHQILGREGATVETAHTGHEALALARLAPYSAALADIRLPDLDGYEVFRRLREVRPGLPVVLMTGFGYDPTHSIVKARREGLQTTLYKPFRADRLLQAAEQALKCAGAGADDRPPADGAAHWPAPTAPEPPAEARRE